MNPDEAAFLNAIRTNPADETARLVYADWLAERDDPRADFARLSAEFLRCVRGLAALRQSIEPDWLADLDPLFNRFVARTLTELDTGGSERAAVDEVLVEPGTPVAAGQPLLRLLLDTGTTEIVAERPCLVTAVFVRRYQPVRLRQPLVAYLMDAAALARRAPRGPMRAHLHALESRRAALRKDSADLVEAMLTRYKTALRMIFGDVAVNAAREEVVPAEDESDDDASPEARAQGNLDTYIATVRVLLARHGQPAWFAPGAE
jgi:uncharacterized protein (TIGR02996 family)